MAYDYAKVQAWLARVPTDDQSALYLWLECLIAHSMRFHEGTKLWELVNEFRLSSLWERTNMLYGLKDLADKVMAYDIHCYAQQARREDEAHDPELQKMIELGFVCGTCRQRYVHHQHPMKPPGVIMCSTCGCTPTAEKADGQGH